MIAANSIKRLLLILVFFIPFFGMSQEKHQETKGKEPDVREEIAHHIADSHEFHILDWNHKPITIPLPIILWTNNGLVTFMSSKFKHDESGSIVVSKGNMNFIQKHGVIYYAPSKEHDEIHTTANHKNLQRPLDFSITKNVFSMFLSAIILFLLFSAVGRSYKKNDKAPKGLAAFLEPLVTFVRDDIAIPNIGEKKYERFMPFLLTVFFFIWINNLIGLIPFFPFGSNLTGNVVFTGVLAIFTFTITNLNGNKNYWKHIFWMPGVPVPMKIILAPIEVIGMFTKPFALMIRLFANIFAGHTIILSLIALIFAFKSYLISPVWVGFSFIMSILELFVGALQAYIFALLSALFIGQAVAEEH